MYLLILSIREETLGIATRIVRERIVQFCIPYHISAPSKQRYIVLLGLLCFLLIIIYLTFFNLPRPAATATATAATATA